MTLKQNKDMGNQHMTLRNPGLGSTVARCMLALVALCAVMNVQAQTSSPPTLSVYYWSTPLPDPAGGLYQVTVGTNTDGNPTLSATQVNSNPWPTGSSQSTEGLTFAANTTTGYTDLVGFNGGTNDVFRLSGPGYGSPNSPGTDISRSTTGITAGGAITADASGNVYAVGVNSAYPTVWYYGKVPNGISPPRVEGLPNSDSFLTGVCEGPCYQFTTLVDTVVARSTDTMNGLAAGDLLVLAGDAVTGILGKPVVFSYARDTIPCSEVCPVSAMSVLVTQDMLATEGGFSSGEQPVSMDVAPDGSLLIATNAGRVWQISPNGDGGFSSGPQLLVSPVADWVANHNNANCDGPCVSIRWVRTALVNGNLDLFVTLQSYYSNYKSAIELYSVPASPELPVKMTSLDVAGLAPFGLAVAEYPSGSADLGKKCPRYPCTIDLLGGAFPTTITGTPQGVKSIGKLTDKTVSQQLCVVEADPRGPDCGYTGSTPPTTLKVSDVCPGFGASVIPDYMCGTQGPSGTGSGTGFALIRGVAEGLDSLNGLIVLTDQNPAAQSLPGWLPFACNGWPGVAAAFGHRSDSKVEQVFVDDPLMFENTGSCGSPRGTGPGLSVGGVGLGTNSARLSHSPFLASYAVGTNPNPFQTWANYKFDFLIRTVNAENIDQPQKTDLLNCINKSETLLTAGKNACAAEKIYRCDRHVAKHPGAYEDGGDGHHNPYGTIRSLLNNLYVIIEVGIEHPGTLSTITDWPLKKDPKLCEKTHEDEGPDQDE